MPLNILYLENIGGPCPTYFQEMSYEIETESVFSISAILVVFTIKPNSTNRSILLISMVSVSIITKSIQKKDKPAN